MIELSNPPVRQERTGWRDEALSKRHRDWGWNCPAIDLDFLMVEYHLGVPVGLIEYKRFTAKIPNIRHRTYQALASLANASNLPFMLAFYWPDIWAFRVHPINKMAGNHFTARTILTEREFVTKLYDLRKLAVDQELSIILKDELPEIRA